ncbi:MAG TPA: hypothetical protein VM869_02490 [Enhygromyxa sp.]|nr:hypothetical protein [Enhygromyxa sp.]
MLAPTVRFACLLTVFTSVLACGTKQPEEAPKTDAKTNAKTDAKPDAKTEPKTEPKPDAKTDAKTEPEPKPEPESTEPPPNRDGVALTIRLKPAPAESLAGFEFSALPAPQGEPLAGIDGWSCTDTSSAPPPCGWAKLCADLGRSWATQIGASEAADALGNAQYQEDCGDDGDVPHESTSGDFVEHAAVIRHRTDALADDGVAGLLVQTKDGWHEAARVREVAVDGMSVKRMHEPRAAWQLELDAHAGRELVLLTTGVQTGGDEPERFAHLIVCYVSPEPSCRRIDLRGVSTLEVLNFGGLVVDGGEPRKFDSLDPADQPLIAPKGP